MIFEKIAAFSSTRKTKDILALVGVSASVWYHFLNVDSSAKIKPKNLDIIYAFFGEKRDEYYEKRVWRSSKRMDIVGDFLRLKRQECGMKIEDVARKLKCSDRQVQNIESKGVQNQYIGIYNSLKELYALSYDEKFELDTLIGMQTKIQHRIQNLQKKCQKKIS